MPLGFPIGLAMLLVISPAMRACIAMGVVSALLLIFCVGSLFSIGILYLPCVGLAVYATAADSLVM